MHLADEQVQRLIHQELTGSDAVEVREHLAACTACRDRVTREEREDHWLLERLRLLDHARPELRAADVIGSPRSIRRLGWGRWAAGFFLALAIGGVAYATPGSPLPRVFARIVQSVRPTARSGATPLAPATRAADAGIAVPPGNRLTVSFLTAVPGDTAVISLSPGSEVVIRARGGSATFTSDPDRVTIGHRGGPARFEILIPQRARLVEVDVAGRRVARKAAAGLTSAAATPDSLGRYVVPLIGP